MKRTVGCSRGAVRGHSLVELLVVISVVSTIAGLLAVALHGMYRADRAARRELETSANLARLTARLRTDAHAAATAELEQDVLWLKSGAGQSISYRPAAGRLERIVRQDEQVVHQDAFRLPANAILRWNLSEQQGGRFVSLEIERPDGAPGRIEAHLGLARRFEKGEE